jgi:PAS domain S-box-containing protein
MQNQTIECACYPSNSRVFALKRIPQARCGPVLAMCHVVDVSRIRTDGVVIRGTANSYQVKQMAQHIMTNKFALPIAGNEVSIRSDLSHHVGTSPPAELPSNPTTMRRPPGQGTTGDFDREPEVLRLIIEQTPIAVIATDRQGTIQVWNSAATELFGYSQDEAIGQEVTIIIPELLIGSHRQGFEKAIKNGRTKYGERAVTMRPVCKSGERCFVNFSFSVLRDRSGDVFGAMATARKVVGVAAW